ncbi:MAG: hypothetical protein LBT46_10420 [Planctomycetaceae bacterium]|nr:hypothetical protein [Planctomycetaceae bacterium]
MKHTLIFGIGGTLAQIAPLILFPLYTNYLPPSELGILEMITRTAVIVNEVLMIAGMRMATLTFYRQAETQEERNRIAVTMSLFLWTMIAFAVLTAVCFSAYLDVFLKTGNPRLLAFGLTVALCETLVGVPMALMQCRLESIRYVLTSWTMIFTRVALNILFLAVFHWGLWGILASTLIVVFVSGVLLTLREFYIGSCLPDVSKGKDVLKFCLPFIPSGILHFCFINSAWVVLVNFGPYETTTAAYAELGLLYAVAIRILSTAKVFGFSPMGQVWTAVMFGIRKQSDAKYVFGNFALRILCVQAFFVLGIGVFASEAILGVCSPEYRGAAALIPIVAAWSMLEVFVWLMEQTYYIEKQTYWKPLTPAVGLPCMLILLWFLVPFGITGVAYSFLTAQCICAAVVFTVTQHFFRVAYPYGKIGVLLGITALFYALSFVCGNAVGLGGLTIDELSDLPKWQRVSHLFRHIDWGIIAAKTGIIGLWCITVWFSGILAPDDKTFVIDSLKHILRKTKIIR